MMNYNFRPAAIALLAAVATIGSASAQSAEAPDFRRGVYRGHSVTYQVIDGLAIWQGDIILALQKN